MTFSNTPCLRMGLISLLPHRGQRIKAINSFPNSQSHAPEGLVCRKLNHPGPRFHASRFGCLLERPPIIANRILVGGGTSLHACGADFPLAICSSTCGWTVTICSGLYLCIGISSCPPSVRFSLTSTGTKITQLVRGPRRVFRLLLTMPSKYASAAV